MLEEYSKYSWVVCFSLYRFNFCLLWSRRVLCKEHDRLPYPCGVKRSLGYSKIGWSLRKSRSREHPWHFCAVLKEFYHARVNSCFSRFLLVNQRNLHFFNGKQSDVNSILPQNQKKDLHNTVLSTVWMMKTHERSKMILKIATMTIICH